MEKEKIKLIEPMVWEYTHIKAHKELNKYVSQFYSRLNKIEEDIEEMWCTIGDVDGDFSSAFSKIEKEINTLTKTLGTIVDEIEKLKAKPERQRKYHTRTYDWILDTDSEITIDLDKIELDWNYLVNVIVNDMFANEEVADYSVWHTTVANKEYTPSIYLKSKWWHAVLEYNFTIILTEI